MSQPDNKLDRQLAAGLDDLGLALDSGARDHLLQYLELLYKWNQAYNLTAVRDLAEMVSRHLLDSLSVLPYLKGPNILDVGTGAGLPGIPVALARPDYQVTLLDSIGKKTRFLTQVRQALGLENIEIIQERIEQFHPGQKFDTLLSRAFARLDEWVNLTLHLCAPGGRWVALKGRDPMAETADLPSTVEIRELVQIKIPGEPAKRHIVVLEFKTTPLI